MPRPAPLPAELPAVFSAAHAVELGVSRSRLDRADLRRPYNGVRGRGPTVAGSVRDACLEFAPRLRPWQFFSHETALLLIGAPMPPWPYQPAVHVSAHRPAREPRVVGVFGHRLQLREPATWHTVQGLRVEHPVRAWRQVGATWRLDDVIAAADFLVSGVEPLASVAELREEIDAMGDVRKGLLANALCWVRHGVRSPRETALRLRLIRAGLPEPDVAFVLRDRAGKFVAELDLAYPRWRVAPEYDGRVHAEDEVQFAKDADRWDRIREQGWDHIRLLNHHMAGDGRVAVEKVRRALIRAGWRPGS